jgi:predicted DNA-binding transcriptional regulator YafY
MAGKNAYFRWLAIDKKLQTGRKYNWQMLAAVCEVTEGVRELPSKRTLQDDIRTLREKFGAPIPKRCPEGLWYYEDTSFSINNNPLFIRDLMLLQQVKNILDQFPELKFSKSLDELIQKVQGNLEIKPLSSPKVIQFEKNKSTIGTEHLETIYNTILEQNVIKLTYQPFNFAKPIVIFVHPYFLKQYNYRWFLVGWNEETELLRLYGLERIKKILLSNKPYKKNEFLEPENYFNDVIGVSIPDHTDIQNVQLKITPQRTPYITTKPLHQSQEIIKTFKSGGMIIELNVIPNFELVALLLSHGSGVKVLKPNSLVEAIENEINNMKQAYKK